MNGFCARLSSWQLISPTNTFLSFFAFNILEEARCFQLGTIFPCSCLWQPVVFSETFRHDWLLRKTWRGVQPVRTTGIRTVSGTPYTCVLRYKSLFRCPFQSLVFWVIKSTDFDEKNFWLYNTIHQGKIGILFNFEKGWLILSSLKSQKLTKISRKKGLRTTKSKLLF